jgi:hypothetical protein
MPFSTIPAIRCTNSDNCIQERPAHSLHIFDCFSLITKFRHWKEWNWIMPIWQLFET